MININELRAPENRGVLSLSMLRIAIGILFLPAALGKIFRDGGFNPLGFLNSRENMFDWYRPIIDSIVAPNAELFGYLVGYGELFLAIALIFGIMLRPAMLLGVFMIANFWFAKGVTFWQASNYDTLYIFIFLVLFFNDSGRFLGLENWLREKFPKIPS
ncbi:MAG: DoxX family protein [Sphingomonadales bacterium]|jgi:thiosulfate dehydrogenase [quinone] large subunit